MIWALSEKSGVPAHKFAALDPPPPLSWLDAFNVGQFLHANLPQFGVPPNKVEDKKLSFSFVHRPTPYTLAAPMALVQRSPIESGWDNVMSAIGVWLIKHIENPAFLLWIANRGGQLDPIFAAQISHAIRTKPISGPLGVVWELILAGRMRGNESLNIYSWIQRFKTRGISVGLRLSLRHLQTPKVRIRAPYKFPDIWATRSVLFGASFHQRPSSEQGGTL